MVRDPVRSAAQLSLTGPDGKVYAMDGDETYFGRHASNTIALDFPRVSRQHARIFHSGDQFFIDDLHSSNGTFLNRQHLTSPAPLHDGDVIVLGDPQATMRVSLRATLPSGEMRLVLRQALAGMRAPRPTVEKIITMNNIVKRYNSGETEITILKGISLEIFRGDFVALLGPSGCGKTTTLNMLIGIDRPDSGEVIVGGQSVHKLNANQMARWRGKNIGVVFQFFQLLPTLTVIENVMMPMNFTKTFPKAERRARAMQCLEMVDMQDRADRLPSALSGGQQQRVAIARALACDPPILVADEPTGNLDSKASQQVFTLLTELSAKGKTIVMVTHDPVLARAIPRRIEMLDGEIVG